MLTYEVSSRYLVRFKSYVDLRQQGDYRAHYVNRFRDLLQSRAIFPIWWVCFVCICFVCIFLLFYNKVKRLKIILRESGYQLSWTLVGHITFMNRSDPNQCYVIALCRTLHWIWGPTHRHACKVGSEAESCSSDPLPYSNHHSMWKNTILLHNFENNA